jgi:hypothetical protein
VRAERELISGARSALQRGDPAAALALIARAERTFGGGVMVQEREVVAIEALSQAGRAGEAKSRAGAFLDRFPDSPHAAHVRRFAK